MKEREFMLEIYSELMNRRVAPILFHGRIEHLSRIYKVKEPWNLLEMYIKFSKNPVISLVRNNSFVFLSTYGKEKNFFIIERDIKNDISLLKKKKYI